MITVSLIAVKFVFYMFEYLAFSFDFPLCKAFLFIKARDYKKNEKIYIKRLPNVK